MHKKSQYRIFKSVTDKSKNYVWMWDKVKKQGYWVRKSDGCIDSDSSFTVKDMKNYAHWKEIDYEEFIYEIL